MLTKIRIFESKINVIKKTANIHDVNLFYFTQLQKLLVTSVMFNGTAIKSRQNTARHTDGKTRYFFRFLFTSPL